MQKHKTRRTHSQSILDPPDERHEQPLSQIANDPDEEPKARQRLQAILDNPSYRLAEKDLDFLSRDDVRGVRLLIDYLKPELLLQQHGISHAIVVFGSTRICEPAVARRNVETLRRTLTTEPGNRALERQIAIAERILALSKYYTVAREFGRLVSAANNVRRELQTVIMTGGGPGIMEAANRGASDMGAKSVGLNIDLLHDQYPNPYITPDLCFRFHYFALRKLHLLERARALVAFPGGYGTFDELFEVLTLMQSQKIERIPVVLVGQEFWRRVIDMDFMVQEGVIDQEDRELFWFAETAEQIWDEIRNRVPTFRSCSDDKAHS